MEKTMYHNFIQVVLIVMRCIVCLAFHGEEMKTNKGPLLQNVESRPFVPDKKNILSPEEVIPLSPDEILKNSEILDSLEILDDPLLLYSFNLESFVEITSDLKMKHELESEIMGLFLNSSNGNSNNADPARVSIKFFKLSVVMTKSISFLCRTLDILDHDKITHYR